MIHGPYDYHYGNGYDGETETHYQENVISCCKQLTRILTNQFSKHSKKQVSLISSRNVVLSWFDKVQIMREVFQLSDVSNMKS